jgi:hypothetical protein
MYADKARARPGRPAVATLSDRRAEEPADDRAV